MRCPRSRSCPGQAADERKNAQARVACARADAPVVAPVGALLGPSLVELPIEMARFTVGDAAVAHSALDAVVDPRQTVVDVRRAFFGVILHGRECCVVMRRDATDPAVAAPEASAPVAANAMRAVFIE